MPDKELTAALRAETEAQLVVDVARHAGDQVHEVVARHLLTMPTVSAAIGLGLLVVKQLYFETANFAVASMDGDAPDGQVIAESTRQLATELLDLGPRRAPASTFSPPISPALAPTWSPMIGERVRVPEGGDDWRSDWQQADLYVAGVAWRAKGGLNVTVAEQWPPRELTDGFIVDAPDQPDDLVQLSPPPPLALPEVLAWIGAAPVDDLRKAAEAMKSHVANINRQLDQGARIQ